MNKLLMISALMIASVSMAKGIYIVSGGDFRIPAATAKIVVDNTNNFLFAKNIYARSDFSIKVNGMEEFKFPANTHTNVMIKCSNPGTYNLKIYDANRKLWYFNFQGCTNILEFTFPEYCSNNDYWSEVFNSSSIERVVLPPTIKTIGWTMFRKCRNLKNLTIPESVRSIGQEGFAWSGLETITIPDTVESLGNNCFEACDTSLNNSTSSLLYVKLSNSMTNIPRRCFNSCKHLETVVLPDGLRSISSEAFIYAIKINNLTFPPSIESIENGAFTGTSSFNSLNFTGTLEQYRSNQCLVQAFGSVPDGEVPENDTIQLNNDGTYSSPRKTLHFNYSE